MKRVLCTAAITAAFALPRSVPAISDTTPLPPVETVLTRVLEKSAGDDDNERVFKERYFFTRTKVTEFRNAKGQVKKREMKKRENSPRPQAAPVPQPVSTATGPETQPPARPEAVSETHSNVRGKAFEKNDFLLNPDLFKRFHFTISGREVLNGRPALIVDFQPVSKKLPPRNLKDRFINKAAGRVWVDENDYALVKADLHLSEPVHVIGGLVGAVWKFTYAFMRDRTADGLWFTRTADWHLEGRELFIRRTVDYHEEHTDVRPVR